MLDFLLFHFPSTNLSNAFLWPKLESYVANYANRARVQSLDKTKALNGFSYIEIMISISIVSFLSILGLSATGLGERFTSNHLIKQQVVSAKHNAIQHKYIINKYGNVFNGNTANNANPELQCMRNNYSDLVSCQLTLMSPKQQLRLINSGDDWFVDESFLSAGNKSNCIRMSGKQWHTQSKSCLTLVYTATH